jgi:HPr kinase/phosphorylase
MGVSTSTVGANVITVRELVRDIGGRLGLRVLGPDAALDRPITTREIQKPGLVVSGFFEFYHPERLQFLGRSEIRFIGDAPDPLPLCRQLCTPQTPGLLVTRGIEPPAPLQQAADEQQVPLLITPMPTADAIGIVLHHLAVHLAPRVRVHGVLVDIFGLGVLILGESGIGKSECALELVERGHRLVADDSVEIALIEDQLIGRAPELTRHHMEVRGLGIVNAYEMFGVTAVRHSIEVEQVVRLVRFEPGMSFERLGLDPEHWQVLDHDLPLYKVPVAPGRSLSVLLEVAARRQLLRRHGSDAARQLRDSLARRLGGASDAGEEE